eukprot:1192257-Prorocentrum_minimum.AAC.2
MFVRVMFATRSPDGGAAGVSVRLRILASMAALPVRGTASPPPVAGVVAGAGAWGVGFAGSPKPSPFGTFFGFSGS